MIKSLSMILSLIGVAFLSGCGVDGAPIRPNAGVNVSVGPGGISVSPSVSVRKGNVGVTVGG